MESYFIPLLKRLIDSRFGKRREFLRAAHPDDVGDSASSTLSKVLSGEIPPPTKRVQAWADALGLDGDERLEFVDLAAIEHLPEEYRNRFRFVRSEYSRLSEDNEFLVKANRRYVKMLKRDQQSEIPPGEPALSLQELGLDDQAAAQLEEKAHQRVLAAAKKREAERARIPKKRNP